MPARPNLTRVTGVSSCADFEQWFRCRSLLVNVAHETALVVVVRAGFCEPNTSMPVGGLQGPGGLCTRRKQRGGKHTQNCKGTAGENHAAR